MKTFDAVVIGAGQAGLAAGYYLKKEGINFCILEAKKVGGSWSEYYESLTLFTPKEYSALPGRPFPGNKDEYPTGSEMSAYLKQYAKALSLPVHEGVEVVSVRKEEGVFTLETSKGDYRAKSVIVSTGPFNEPHIPHIEGMETYRGELLHTHEYRNPERFAGKRVVVVGGGASAVQIAVELAEVADVTLARKRPVRFLPRRILGKDLTFWSTYTVDLFKIPMKGSWVIDTYDKKYEKALKAHRPPQRNMFNAFCEDGVVWGNGEKERVDVVMFGTGYKPTSPFLESGADTCEPGLFFLGMPNQRNYASATVRGAGRDARIIVKKVAQFLKGGTVRAAR